MGFLPKEIMDRVKEIECDLDEKGDCSFHPDAEDISDVCGDLRDRDNVTALAFYLFCNFYNKDPEDMDQSFNSDGPVGDSEDASNILAVSWLHGIVNGVLSTAACALEDRIEELGLTEEQSKAMVKIIHEEM